uniref:hypothetical protein n=1 Tax=Malassezia nana TaxID=180528 RepID=UPI0030035C01|nr:hypothetical protein [Malassezia nana]
MVMVEDRMNDRLTVIFSFLLFINIWLDIIIWKILVVILKRIVSKFTPLIGCIAIKMTFSIRKKFHSSSSSSRVSDWFIINKLFIISRRSKTKEFQLVES